MSQQHQKSEEIPRGTLALVLLLTAGAVVGSIIVIGAGGERRVVAPPVEEVREAEKRARFPTDVGVSGTGPRMDDSPAREWGRTDEAGLPAPAPAALRPSPSPDRIGEIPLDRRPHPIPYGLGPSPFAEVAPIELPADPEERMRVVREKLAALSEEIEQARIEMRASVREGSQEARIESRRRVGQLLRERANWVRRARTEGLDVPPVVPRELKGLRVRTTEDGQQQ